MAQADKLLFMRTDTLRKLAVVKCVRDENLAPGLSKGQPEMRAACCRFEGQVLKS